MQSVREEQMSCYWMHPVAEVAEHFINQYVFKYLNSLCLTKTHICVGTRMFLSRPIHGTSLLCIPLPYYIFQATQFKSILNRLPLYRASHKYTDNEWGLVPLVKVSKSKSQRQLIALFWFRNWIVLWLRQFAHAR